MIQIFPLSGGGGTLTSYINNDYIWGSIARGSYLQSSIIEWCKNDNCRGIVHTFHMPSNYAVPDCPWSGEAHIIKIPCQDNYRWCILVIPYDPNNVYNFPRIFFIGYGYKDFDAITWDEYNFEDLCNRPRVYTSYDKPTSSDGKDGDVWIKY